MAVGRRLVSDITIPAGRDYYSYCALRLLSHNPAFSHFSSEFWSQLMDMQF
jgi:hypothetical protein